jgi:hypothetical protein
VLPPPPTINKPQNQPIIPPQTPNTTTINKPQNQPINPPQIPIITPPINLPPPNRTSQNIAPQNLPIPNKIPQNIILPPPPSINNLNTPQSQNNLIKQ